MGNRSVWIVAACSAVLSVLSFIADLPGKVAGMTSILQWLDSVPGWGWGVAFLILAIAIPIYAKLTNKCYQRDKQENIEQRRRQLIRDWRAMMGRVAQWYIENRQPHKDMTDELIAYIEKQPEYFTLKPYLKSWDIHPDRVATVDSSLHGRILWLNKNIDRLECEWSLLES